MVLFVFIIKMGWLIIKFFLSFTPLLFTSLILGEKFSITTNGSIGVAIILFILFVLLIGPICMALASLLMYLIWLLVWIDLNKEEIVGENIKQLTSFQKIVYFIHTKQTDKIWIGILWSLLGTIILVTTFVLLFSKTNWQLHVNKVWFRYIVIASIIAFCIEVVLELLDLLFNKYTWKNIW